MDMNCLICCRWRTGLEGVSGPSETEIKPDEDDPRYPGAEAGRQAGERSEDEL